MDPAEASQALDELMGTLPVSMAADQLWAEPRLCSARERLAAGQPVGRTIAECRVRLGPSVANAIRRGFLPFTIAYPEQLPVSAAHDEIMGVLAQHRTFVLTGETGSGKTTQLPKMLLEAGYGRRGMIALTQPRRVAAYAMAARLREEMEAPEGIVAHSVRFDDQSGADTLVRVVTDGLLLAEAARDPLLGRYDAILVDEAHERSLNIDLLLGLLRQLRARRPDLVIGIASASIAVERFAEYLGHDGVPAPIVRVDGRTFPVEVRWRPPADEDLSYLAAAVQAVRDVHAEGGTGDVLCFLPTERDILDAAKRLHDLPGATCVPLFSRLTPGEQQRVFKPMRGRKVVLATNIAETSLTIPGIVYVIDAGMARIKRYAAGARTERLPIEAVAQASCVQRAGRAGRVQAGVAIRLYDEQDFAARAPYTDPEILRSNLAGVVVQCLSMGLGDPERIPWLDPPAPGAWQQARVLLEELGALEEVRGPSEEVRGPWSVVPLPAADARPRASRAGGPSEEVRGSEDQSQNPLPASPAVPTTDHGPRTTHPFRLSPLGRRLAAIPADPAVARILIAGIENGVAHEACTIAAFLSVQDPRVRPLGSEAKADAAHRAFAHEAGDLTTVLQLWDRWQDQPSQSARVRFAEASWLGVRRMREWSDVRHQLWSSLRDQRGGVPLPPTGHAPGTWPIEAVHRAVLAGMLGNVLMYDRELRLYRAGGDRQLAVHPGSALRSGKHDDGKRAPPPPPWLVACEVVETSRLFARLCAPIDPEWVVELAGDRVKRRHRDARWHPKRRQVVCAETVTWRGLPIRDGRLVPYERIDAKDATAIFVREALAGDAAAEVGHEVPAIARNHALAESLARLRHRLRDPDLWLDGGALEGAYRVRLGLDGETPPVIASTDALKGWLKEHGDEAIRLRGEDFVGAEAFARAEREAPESATMRGAALPIRYRYAPGEDDDGATLELREEQVGALDASRLDWLVPAFHLEVTEAWLRQLPKDQRRHLIPLAESVTAILAAVQPHEGRLAFADAVHAEVERRVGPCARPLAETLPPHLRLRFLIRGEYGAVVYAGRDPGFVLGQAGAAADRLAPLRAEHETAPSATWPAEVERLPAEIQAVGVVGYRALARTRDAGGGVAARVAVHATAEAARIWHEDGVDALLEAALAEPLDRLAAEPVPGALAARIERMLGGRTGGLRRQFALRAALDVEPRKARDATSFADLLARATAALPTAVVLDALLDRASSRVEVLRGRLKQGARNLAAAGAQRLAAHDLERLVGPGWPGRLPWATARKLDANLDAIARRLDLAQTRPADAQRLAERAEALLGEYDHALSDDQRLLAALGLGRTTRELSAALEDALLALGTSGTGASAGFAEARLRHGLGELHKAVSAARAAVRATVDRLVGAREQARRLRPGPLRERLVGEVDRLIGGFPELGLGADLAAQHQAALACCDRVRAASNRV